MIDKSYTLTAAGSTPVLPLDWRAEYFQFSVAVIVTGNCTGNVQYTLDDPFANYGTQTFVSAANWINFPTVNAVTTASTDFSDNLAFPAKAVRGRITSYTSGSVKFQFLQATGD